MRHFLYAYKYRLLASCAVDPGGERFLSGFLGCTEAPCLSGVSSKSRRIFGNTKWRYLFLHHRSQDASGHYKKRMYMPSSHSSWFDSKARQTLATEISRREWDRACVRIPWLMGVDSLAVNQFPKLRLRIASKRCQIITVGQDIMAAYDCGVEVRCHTFDVTSQVPTTIL